MSKLGKLETISWWWHALSEVKWKQVNTDVDYYVWCNTWQLVDSQVFRGIGEIKASVYKLVCGPGMAKTVQKSPNT